uniref:Uncharacterized protein n=1 Tax=Arundo donax TaxID=35708 RepID=A0A0A9EUF4_ARUDO
MASPPVPKKVPRELVEHGDLRRQHVRCQAT